MKEKTYQQKFEEDLCKLELSLGVITPENQTYLKENEDAKKIVKEYENLRLKLEAVERLLKKNKSS